MEEQILDAYQGQRADKSGKAPALTKKDHEVAKLAASYTESELRQAVAMRGAYERQQRRSKGRRK